MGDHELSHHGGDQDKLTQYEKINTWHVEQFAYMLDRMKSIREGEGTLLDHSMILFGSSLRDGNRHDPHNLPMVLAGFRIGLSRALIGVVLGEMFSSNAGLGFRMTVYAAHLKTADVFVPLVAFVVIGVITTQLALLLESRLQSWKS